MTDWHDDILENCLETLLDYRGKSPPKASVGIPVLSAKVVKTSGLQQPIKQKISFDYYAKWMVRGLPHVGDVVMTTEGPMGEVIQLTKETAQYALGQRIVCLRGKIGILNNTFLRYLLSSPSQQNILKGYSTGTTVPGISQKALRSLPISYPPFDTQRQIGILLSALDDKIDINRRTNETLEAMARALFRDWFVDFGPTRAKMAGEASYLAPELWELFPDRLDDEGKPEGWHYQTLDTLCERTIGGLWGEEEETPKSPSEFICLRGVDLQHLKETGMCPNAPKRWGNINAIQKRIIQPNEFLIASSGAGPCGRSLWLGKFTHNIDVDIPVIFSNFVKKFTTPDEAIACYIEFIISNMRRSGEIQSFINGASVPNLDDDALLKTYTILDPGIKIIRNFFEFIVSVLNIKISKKSCTLAQLRDLLLPRLMSGEISIRNAEKIAEDVT